VLWPSLVVVTGYLAVFVPVMLGIGVVPVVPELLMIGGTAWAWARKRWIGAGVLTLLTGFHLVWFFFLSSYAPPENPPAPGAAPEITATRVRDGAAFSLAAQQGHGVLLVFFRGGW